MSQIRVLIAEDDFRVASIWREFTHKIEGFTVAGEARTGKEALAIAQKEPIDLLVTDVYMPEMDGIELLYEIRKQELPLDVIIISAAKETHVVRRFLRMGIIDYITKPCSFERYQVALERFQKIHQAFSGPEIPQQLLDSIIYSQPINTSDNDRILPKGLQQMTMDRILAQFEENPFSQSAEEIAAATSLSIATIQRYLRHLTQVKILTKELMYGTQGRPEHKYTKV